MSQPLGQRQNPLAQRQPLDHVVDQVSGGLDHAPGIARVGTAAPLAEGDQEVMAALLTARPGEPMRQESWFMHPT